MFLQQFITNENYLSLYTRRTTILISYNHHCTISEMNITIFKIKQRESNGKRYGFLAAYRA